MTERAVALSVLTVAVLLGGCRGGGAAIDYAAITGGDPRAGQIVVRARHCGACHDVPHVTGAHGVIGPPLVEFSRRSFIAGAVPNNPSNLVTWIRFPRTIEPATAMPTLGLDEREARDAAAFLYTLR
ncbi:MAG TPA: c-type cytochrome [Polyangia bacterium]|jgi:cytochrome c2|nr:c-type cytochrome [Polyangia bacterium]